MEKSIGLQMMELTTKIMNDIVDSKLPASLVHYVVNDISHEINAQAKNNLVTEINELQENNKKEDLTNE